MMPTPKMPNPTNHMRPTVVGAFILPSAAGTREYPVDSPPNMR